MKICKGLILFIIFILTFSNAFSVEFNSIDSLRNALNQAKGDEKISLQLDLALRINETKINEADSLSQEALKAAQRIKNRLLEMRAYLILGTISPTFEEKG
ncbi:MAG: hypothetical protein JW833_08400, partial [Prolixibacteraceae bacterium]|nr:hypothetical protein [Prolixibacteraceae bacterium]